MDAVVAAPGLHVVAEDVLAALADGGVPGDAVADVVADDDVRCGVGVGAFVL